LDSFKFQKFQNHTGRAMPKDKKVNIAVTYSVGKLNDTNTNSLLQLRHGNQLVLMPKCSLQTIVAFRIHHDTKHSGCNNDTQHYDA
jgi:hypothetical protein